ASLCVFLALAAAPRPFERVQARGTPGRFAWSFGWPPAAQAQRRSRVSSATTPRRTAGALQIKSVAGPAAGSGRPVWAGSRAARDMFSTAAFATGDIRNCRPAANMAAPRAVAAYWHGPRGRRAFG